MELVVVFMEPESAGNIGALCRVMKNFSCGKLRLVNPKTEITSAAYSRAMHAQDVLDGREVYDSLEKAVEDCALVLGSTGRSAQPNSFVRNVTDIREIGSVLDNAKGKVALILGREGIGLLNEELKLCDAIFIIPADEDYPVLNVTHAAAVLLYEIFRAAGKTKPIQKGGAKPEEMKALQAHFNELTELSAWPEEKKERMKMSFKRVIGRAGINYRELGYIIMVLRNAIKRITKRDKE